MPRIPGTSCDRAAAQISLRLDGELSSFEEATLRAHLAACRACRAYEQETATFTTLVRESSLEPFDLSIVMPRRHRLALRPLQVGAAAAMLAERFLDNIETVVHGKREEIKLVLAALVAGGHVLFEDVPGTAKTVLARAIAQSIEGATPSRIQCTPDLQPTDVTGLSVFNQKERDFEFRPGPIFANVVLVDEINRAMPKTQSALLEAMAEHRVTVDGVTRRLPDPFLLLATENPIEYEGTFPLPEAQLDRFFLRTSLGYPGEEQEIKIVREQRHGHPLDGLQTAITKDEVTQLRL